MHDGTVSVLLDVSKKPLAGVAPGGLTELSRGKLKSIEVLQQVLSMFMAYSVHQCIPHTLSPMTLQVEGDMDKVVASHETLLIHQQGERLPCESLWNVSKHDGGEVRVVVAALLSCPVMFHTSTLMWFIVVHHISPS